MKLLLYYYSYCYIVKEIDPSLLSGLLRERPLDSLDCLDESSHGSDGEFVSGPGHEMT